MDRKTILVINPNSNEAVTRIVGESVAPLRFVDGPPIECITLREGPFGIESQVHAEQVVLPLARIAETRTDAAAFVIACYADPGIDAMRSVAAVPVFGSQESAILTGLARGDRLGVIAASNGSIKRHGRYLRRLGLLDRIASERPVNMSVDEIATAGHGFERLVAVGRALIDDGADAIVLGCAGMARYRPSLEQTLGVPIIEPTQAAVAMALAAVRV